LDLVTRKLLFYGCFYLFFGFLFSPLRRNDNMVTPLDRWMVPFGSLRLAVWMVRLTWPLTLPMLFLRKGRLIHDIRAHHERWCGVASWDDVVSDRPSLSARLAYASTIERMMESGTLAPDMPTSMCQRAYSTTGAAGDDLTVESQTPLAVLEKANAEQTREGYRWSAPSRLRRHPT
jgi:hypothetical protein